MQNISRAAADPRVRVISMGGRFLGTVPHEYAKRMVRERRAGVVTAKRSRLTCVVDFAAHIGESVPGGHLKTFQVEHLRDTLRARVLKRIEVYRETYTYIQHSGKVTVKHSKPVVIFRPWDPGLTFKELREGQLVSAETRRRRALEAEQARFARTA